MGPLPVPGAPARLGFGGWAVGGSGWGSPGDERERAAAVERAVERGIVFFDTAPTYGDSERLLGRLLAAHRDRVVLATKVGPRDDPRTSLEGSLRRIGWDAVDLIQLHEPGEQLEATIEKLARLVEEGKARAIGLCNASPRQLATALSIAPLATFQAPYNLIDRDAEWQFLPVLRRRGVTFVAYRPLASGMLAGRFDAATPPGFAEGDHRRRIYWFRGREYERRRAVVERLRALAEHRGVSVPALAIGWVLARRGVGVVLAGARTPQQVDENAAAAERPLRREELAAVDAIVSDVYRLARVVAASREPQTPWGQRERFIVDRLDGSTTCESIAAAWSEQEEQPMITAQVRVFVDDLADRGLASFDA